MIHLPPGHHFWVWTWHWLPNTHYNHVHRFGDNVFFDWLRVVCIILACILLFTIGRVLVETYRRAEPMPPGQVFRFISLGLATVSIGMTEMAVAGSVATPRIAINMGAVIFGFVGLRSMRRKQKNQPVKFDKPVVLRKHHHNTEDEGKGQ